MNDKLYAELGLSLIQFVGSMRYQRLTSYFKSADAVFQAELDELKKVVPPRVAHLIAKGIPKDLVEKHLKWQQERPNRYIISYSDPRYSQLLKNIIDPPMILYAVGDISLLNQPSIAIVGSRQCSQDGLETTQLYAEQLSEKGVCIVSGLANGIDSYAHKGGLLHQGSSIAVMATGMDLIYPAQNKQLAIELAEKGLLVSEQPLGMQPIGKHFPQRNRIISGLSHATLVVEATDRSGSLVTARQAIEQGREVFAIPGSIYSPTHVGCHLLLKKGEAGLTDCVDDILDYIQNHSCFKLNYKPFVDFEIKTDEFPALSTTKSKNQSKAENPIQTQNTYSDHPILKYLSSTIPIELDELTEKTNLDTAKLLEELLMLELEDKIVADAGFFKLKS